MSIATFHLGPLSTNCYVIHNATDALVIDPGGERAEGLTDVLDYLESHRLTVRGILITHFHFDHLYGVVALHEQTKAPIYGAPCDPRILPDKLNSGQKWGMPKVTPFTWTELHAGPMTLGSLEFTVFETPGHSPDSLSFYFPAFGLVCTGDLLFHRSVGRTDFEGGDHPTLVQSVRSHIFTLPPKTRVYAGHGAETSVSDEIQHNPYL